MPTSETIRVVVTRIEGEYDRLRGLDFYSLLGAGPGSDEASLQKHFVDKASRFPVADIEQAHVSSSSCSLANLSAQLGRGLAWDPATHRIPGDEEANRLLARPYRSPWVHPDPTRV